MKQRWKKTVSRLLTICLVLSLLPAMPVKADGTGGIIIDVPPISELTVDGEPEDPDYGTISVEARAASGGAISYQWVYIKRYPDGSSVMFGPSGGVNSSLSLPGDLDYELFPGEYEFYCELTAGGATVRSSSTIVTVRRLVYGGTRTGEAKVKSGQAVQAYEYALPELPTGIYYDTTGNADNTLVSGTPRVVHDPYDGAKLVFDTTGQSAGTSDTITLDLIGASYYEDSTFTLNVTAVDKVPLTITGMTRADATYSGRGWSGYTGSPSAANYPGGFTYSYAGREGTVYGDSSEAPLNAGNYTLTVSPADADYEGTASIDFSIGKKEVRVVSSNYFMGRQGALPEIGEDIWVQYVGFVGTDTMDNCLSDSAVLRLNVTDSNTPGTYPIDFLTEARLNDHGNVNYFLSHEAATLTISPFSNNTQVLQINLPSAVIDSGTSQTVPSITASVANNVSSHTVSATVSDGATWALYRDEALTQQITDRTVSLAEGANTVYLAVTAESGMASRRYRVTITRRSAGTQSDPPPDSGSGTGSSTGNQENTSVYKATGSDSSWKAIGESIGRGGSDQVTVEMRGTSVIPASILETIAGRDVTVSFDLGGGVSWNISGSDLKALTEKEEFDGWKALDMKATVGSSNIPAGTLEDFAKQLGQEDTGEIVPVRLNHEGDFGFTAYLSVYIDSAKAGKTANLFYYNPATKQMEFQYAGVINERGYVEFPFTHASDYAIALDDGKLLQAELDKVTVSPVKKTLYSGGNTGKEANIRISLPDSLKNLSKEDSLYPAVTYTSSNPKVVSVTAAGKVKALKAGKATITATVTAGEATRTLTTVITVKKAYIKLVKEKKSFKTGESYTYQAIGCGITADKITWSTAKKAVVVIDKKTGKAAAKSKGTDYVTAKYGSIRKTIKVTVK